MNIPSLPSQASCTHAVLKSNSAKMEAKPAKGKKRKAGGSQTTLRMIEKQS